ncbi:hypothetical protein [Gordonia sp. MMO-8]|uniref:hypothetical protein n=1 Tax=Gordonia sp. MMO-8 TaxID=3127886 RepID=UPI003019C431
MRSRPFWKIRKVGDGWVVYRRTFVWAPAYYLYRRVSTFADAVAVVETGGRVRRDYALASA